MPPTGSPPTMWITGTAAIMMLLMNLAGSQISAGLTPLQKKTLQSPWIRYVAIYAIFFVGTRNPWLTLLIGSATILILDVFLNESSRYFLFRRTSTLPLWEDYAPGSIARRFWSML